MDKSVFNKRLMDSVREKRKELKFTQQQMADLLGLSRAQYVNCENRKNSTSIYNMVLLCQILQVEMPKFSTAFLNIKSSKCRVSTKEKINRRKKRLEGVIKKAEQQLRYLQ